jgi:hypothetical protein
MPACQICKLANVGTHPPQTRTTSYSCERCGEYAVSFETVSQLDEIDDGRRPRISRWIREQNRLGSPPIIHGADIATFAQIPALTFVEKAERVLTVTVEKTTRFGQVHAVYDFNDLQAYSETFDRNELVFIAKYLVERGFLDDKRTISHWSVTGQGFERVEQRRKTNASSSQAFVAMWFNPDLDQAWKEGFANGIVIAGYAPLRIDGKQHNHKICDEIVAEIRRSRFLVADFTGHRGGVYYEAGFAAGLAIPVIFTCRKDQMGDLHFDVRQFNTIDWSDPPDLANRLKDRICATIGDGPLRAAS